MKRTSIAAVFAMLAGIGAGGSALWHFSHNPENNARLPETQKTSPGEIESVSFLKQSLPVTPPALVPPAADEIKPGDATLPEIAAFAPDIPEEIAGKMIPTFLPAITPPDTNFDIFSKEFYLRNAVNSAVKNYLPITLNLIQPIYSGDRTQFRPVFTAGVGVLGQTAEASLSPGEREFEMRMMFRAGFNMEWSPATEWVVRLGYEYFRLAEPFAMSPDFPQQSHGVTFGLEHRF